MSRDTLNALLLGVREDFADAAAVVEHTELGRRVMTYQELWDTSRIISEALSQLCSQNDQGSQFIGVCLDPCFIFPAVILGVFQNGFAFACVDPVWGKDRKFEYLRKLGAPLLIHGSNEWRPTSQEMRGRALQVQDTTLYFEVLKSDGYFKECPHPMAYAVLTSGSTGNPKVVRVPYQSIVPNIIALRKICEIDSRDVIFLSSPPTFDPSVVDIFLAFTTGASLLVTSKSIKTSAASLLQILFPLQNHQGISVLQTTPSLFFRWSERELQQVVLSAKTSLRVLLLGGEAFPSYLKLKRCREPGNKTHIYNIYGITEVSAWGCIHHVSFSDSHNHTEGKIDRVPLGRALPDTILQVRDCTDNSIVQKGNGEMYIGSLRRVCEIDDEICADYSLPVFRPTGDIVEIEADGNIYYVGRKNLVIKRWGHRVNLENIEDIALNHTSVKNAFCYWDDVQHKLYLIATVRDNVTILDLQRYFLQSVRQDDRMLIPDEILLVPEISLTHHGKVNRHVDFGLLDMTISTQRKFRVQRQFAQFFSQALGLASLGLEGKYLEERSFLDLGGNSMVAMTLITELEAAFGSCPDDLAGLLLSGKSLKDTCDRLCQYYETKPPITEQDGTSTQCGESEESFVEKTLKLKKAQENFMPSTSEGPCKRDIEASLKSMELIFSWKVNMGKCIDASPLCIMFER
ncbi:hypothetical protein ONE63_005631 [Megalurothrips usitatus]|uniref:Carrier domain-containing protein n=1 Tax=Megalurothrips usitatus TaxID=439358 RepID=A0AAV7Y093_9NEOP|nr:hypothetical protein ONE63_005631 [Megalurothrips usitatus]